MDRRRVLLLVLVLLAVAGLLLHLRVHPVRTPDKEHPGMTLFRPQMIPATALPLLDVVLVTALFAARRTAVYGYVLNGFIVIYGTVLMADFSIAQLAPRSPGIGDWLLRTTLPDIGIAWADFFVGKLLYDSWTGEA